MSPQHAQLKEKTKDGNDLFFFQNAYVWVFGKRADVYPDVVAWKDEGKIPGYMLKYLVHCFPQADKPDESDSFGF